MKYAVPMVDALSPTMRLRDFENGWFVRSPESGIA
jgi:hypothetical protein